MGSSSMVEARLDAVQDSIDGARSGNPIMALLHVLIGFLQVRRCVSSYGFPVVFAFAILSI